MEALGVLCAIWQATTVDAAKSMHGGAHDEHALIWCLRRSRFTLAFANDRTWQWKFERGGVVVYL